MSEKPSLVGVSVRDIDDSENPDYVPGKSPALAHLNETVKKLHIPHTGVEGDHYASVDELNKEGALLTDAPDVDLDTMIAKGLDDISELKSSMENKKKNKKKSNKSSSYSEISDSSNVISPSNSGTVESLITSTDPIDDNIIGAVTNDSAQDPRATDNLHAIIRNSYGEVINPSSDRPHLARGDSYQQSVEETNGVAMPNARSGRSSSKRMSSDYLRSLSRSLQRDHKKDLGEVPSGIDTIDRSIYSTTSYSISQRDLENAPHVIKEEAMEGSSARH